MHSQRCRQRVSKPLSSAMSELMAMAMTMQGGADIWHTSSSVRPDRCSAWTGRSEPQPLGDSSTTPSTSRSLPLRNSSLTNSRRQATKAVPVPGRRFQKRVISPMKASPMARGGAAASAGFARRNNATTMGSPANGSRKGFQASGVTPPTQKRPTKNKPDIPQGQGNLELNLVQEEREWAATRINAAVRGFLLRQLFKTEQVQRIVQTIQDTLIFVLNLHLETRGKDVDAEEPANLRLKARLLQQLCSASRALDVIFFQTSTKERMEIISRDRKRKKLLALSPKHR